MAATKKQRTQRPTLLVILIGAILLACAGIAVLYNMTNWEIPRTKVEIAENRTEEFVFTLTPDEYIQCFNEKYRSDYHRDYLDSLTKWRKESYKRGVHSSYETVCYDFSEDYTVWTLPTISVYTASDSNLIQEITINFDDHSYQPDMYALYEEICYYTLQVFYPDADNETLTWLYQMMNNHAYQNMLPNGQGFQADCVPLILYHHNGIGVYSYASIGESMHFCVIPVTETTLRNFNANGTEIHEIPLNGRYDTAEKTANDMGEFPDNELLYVTETCQEIADILNETERLAEREPSRYMSEQTVITQSSIDEMEMLLIEHGYAVLDTDSRYPAFLENAEELYNFRNAVKKGNAARADYVWLSPYGGFHYCILEYRNGESYFLEAATEWTQGNTIEITELYKRELLDWELTDKDNFYYKLYEAHSPAFEDYTLLRLSAPDKELSNLSMTYLEPVGYQSNNLLSSEWSCDDYKNLCLNDILEFLYREHYGQILDSQTLTVHEHPFYYQIPADVFESVMIAYFDITPEKVREVCCYDANTDTYPWLDVAYDNLNYFPLITPEVTAYRKNADGTLTLTVDAMCVGLKTDSLFRHELTIRPDTDGSFQYIGNRLISASDTLPEYIPRLEMQR